MNEKKIQTSKYPCIGPWEIAFYLFLDKTCLNGVLGVNINFQMEQLQCWAPG